MKKNGLIAIIAAAAVIITGCAVLLIIKSGDSKNYAAANESLKTQWSEYAKGTDSEVLTAVLAETEYGVKDITEAETGTTVTVNVEAKRLGEAVKEFNEQNKEPIKKEEQNAKLLELLDNAEETEKAYVLPVQAGDGVYKYTFTPEFINAMLGFVYSDEEVKAEGFEKTAIANFEKAVSLQGEIEYNYEKIDAIIKNSFSVARYENKLYYAESKTITEDESYTIYQQKLKCYDMENDSEETIKNFDCEYNEDNIRTAYIGCLSEGALIAEEYNDYYDGDNYKRTVYLYDYKEGKLSKVNAETDVAALEIAVLADYKDGTVYYSIGQDGMGDVKKFTLTDDAETTAIDLNGDYLYINTICARNGALYTDLLDRDIYEKSHYKNEVYDIYRNSGTSLGEKIVTNIDGAFCTDENDNFLYVRDSALMSYSPTGNTETEIVKTDLKYQCAHVYLKIGDYAYITTWQADEDNITYPEMYKINVKTGEKLKFKDASQDALYR